MPEQLMQFKATTPLKVAMTLVVAFSLLASWFVVRWYIGNTMAEYYQPDDTRLDTARMAVGLAPNDPLPHWRLGNVAQNIYRPIKSRWRSPSMRRPSVCPQTITDSGWSMAEHSSMRVKLIRQKSFAASGQTCAFICTAALVLR